MALLDAGGGLFAGVAAWSSWALSRSLGQPEPNVGYTVSRLLAGIVLVDLLAVASSSEPWIGVSRVVCAGAPAPAVHSGDVEPAGKRPGSLVVNN
jgi:hypothetical protein